MEANGVEIPSVTLSPFRFTDRLISPDHTANETYQSNENSTQSSWGPQHPPDPRRPGAYERMAADKPGEELAHDATIWKLYLEEAEEYDQELVKSRHGSLDMLLLFAALFSAILTAFLIESKNLLQQNPTDASAALLLMVVQSQQRIELNLPSPVDTPIIDLPAFVPPVSARWINGIWFTSLALSLSAALVAMLGKEWLTAYIASRPRPPRSHALLRQARLEGLERWWALHIIALLPSLLHTSLFLFAIGLVIYLCTLDTVIAGIVAGVIGITLLFYVITAVLGAMYEHCPFVTQISGYIKRAFDRYVRPRPSEDDPSSVTSVKDLQALLWLANNARDPAVVDCSYHALVGLHHKEIPASPFNSNNTRLSTDPTWQVLPRLPMQINSDTTMLSLFYTLAERLRKVATNPQILSSTSGTNLERYATALVWSFNYIKDFKLDTLDSNGQEHRVQKEPDSWNQPSTLESGQMQTPSAEYILSLLDDIWNNNNASFSANTYARLLATQMTLLNLAALLQSQSENMLSRTPVGKDFSVSRGLDTATRSSHVINIIVSHLDSPDLQRLADLRASYSRALCRISYLLRLYSKGQIQVGVPALIGLLGALKTAASCEELNPQDSSSTHHAQRNSGTSLSFSMRVSGDNANIWCFNANDLHGGPLGSLIEILRMKPDVAEAMLLRTRIAAIEAFSTLAPVLLQQVLRLERAELYREFDFENWSELPPFDMQGVRYVASRQMFLLLRYLGPKLNLSDTHRNLVSNALDLIHTYVKDVEDRRTSGARLAVQRHGEDLVPLIEFASASSSNIDMLGESSAFDLVALARTQWFTMCETVLSPICFPALIQMVAPAKLPTPTVETLLQSMLKRIHNGPIGPREPNVSSNNTPSIDYLDCFTHTNKGFFALSSAAIVPEHLGVVVDAIVEFIHLAANRHHVLEGAPIELQTPAVPGFLDVISVVAKYCFRIPERQQMLLGFSQDVSTLLEVVTDGLESRELILKHGACNDLYSALENIREQADAIEILDQVKNLRRKLGIESPVEESTEEPKVGHSDISALTDVNASDNDRGSRPGDIMVISSANEESNIT